MDVWLSGILLSLLIKRMRPHPLGRGLTLLILLFIGPASSGCGVTIDAAIAQLAVHLVHREVGDHRSGEFHNPRAATGG